MFLHLLLTGKPGVGKTTLIERVVTQIRLESPHLLIAGFITKEVRSQGKRIGFNIHTLDGQRGILARTEFPDNKERPRVGKYLVDLEALETLGAPALEKRADLVVLDEIGKMELLSSAFKAVIHCIFTRTTLILATIARYDTPDTRQIKNLPNVKIIEVTLQNRVQLVDELLNNIKNVVNL